MLMFMGPVVIAFVLGILVGWAWKPRWAKSTDVMSLIPSNQSDVMSLIPSNQSVQAQSSGSGDKPYVPRKPVSTDPSCSSSSCVKEEENSVVTDEDLKHLWHLVERKDGVVPWKHMMDRSTPRMHYQAWQRDPEIGPPQYCSKTVYENATPELVRDFYWDDEFRLKWDDMLLHASTLQEFPAVGASIVHWIRKFPFFCSDREYTIARRIWELGTTYYCVTKGVPCASIPRKKAPRRVDLYYSSWFIQAVESKNGADHPACEVTFFHHEDMGIPWEIAKFGVRQGMWGAARNVERGFRSYQEERAFSKTISLHVVMARMSTKINQNHLVSLESDQGQDEDQDVAETQVGAVIQQEKQHAVGTKVPKLLVFGGAVMVACSIDRGLLTKAIIFGIAKRVASLGKKTCPQPLTQ